MCLHFPKPRTCGLANPRTFEVVVTADRYKEYGTLLSFFDALDVINRDNDLFKLETLLRPTKSVRRPFHFIEIGNMAHESFALQIIQILLNFAEACFSNAKGKHTPFS